MERKEREERKRHRERETKRETEASDGKMALLWIAENRFRLLWAWLANKLTTTDSHETLW